MARRLVRIRLDAHVERPWQRGSFRHPDLMTWVRANRARLVSACLTLCQAWIAAGRPRGSKAIGSYENWAGTIGGILEVAGIEGFLGNLDEMMAASDAEGSAWEAFVTGRWYRFGTAEVKAGDLHPIAITSEPPLSLGSGSDQSQRTRLGKALAKMRDRVFAVADRNLRLEAAGLSHQAMQWRLAIAGEGGEVVSRQNHGIGGEVGDLEGRFEIQTSPTQPLENEGSGEGGEVGEVVSTLTHARARTTHIESTGKTSPSSPPSPSRGNSGGYGGEDAGEVGLTTSPTLPEHKSIPAWLREVME